MARKVSALGDYLKRIGFGKTKKACKHGFQPSRMLRCEPLESRTLLSVYYIDSIGGDDSNAGTEAVPWQTLGKVNDTDLAAGDTVLFKRGGEYRDNSNLLPQDGTLNNPVTFGAYGDPIQPLPKILGSAERNYTSDWSLVSGTTNIWQTARAISSVSTTGSTELVSNTDFTNIDNWSAVIGGDASAAFIASSGAGTFACTNPGMYEYSLQARIGGITLHDGDYYSLSFQAKVDTGTITIPKVTLYEGATVADIIDSSAGATPTITTTWTTYTILFQANTTTSCWLSFHLGGYSGTGTPGLPGGRTFYLDNVSLKNCTTTNNERLLDAKVGNLIFNNADTTMADNSWSGYRCPVPLDANGIPIESTENILNAVNTLQPTRATKEGNYYTKTDSDNHATLVYLYCEQNPAVEYNDIEITLDGAVVDAGSYTIYEYLDIRYGGSHGVWYQDDCYSTISNCNIAYCGGAGFGAVTRHGNGIEIYSGASNITIDSNNIWEILDAAFGVEALYGNTIDNVQFENNIVSNCGMGCIVDSGSNSMIEEVYFVNNTISYSGYQALGGSQWTDSAGQNGVGIQLTDLYGAVDSLYFYNNIVYMASYVGMMMHNFDDWGNTTLDNNLYYMDTSNAAIHAPWGTNYYMPGRILGAGEESFESWYGDSNKDQNSIATDPQFVDPENHDFHLLPTSPAIDAGHDVDLSEDYDGAMRPLGFGYDIGAFECLPYYSSLVNLDFNSYPSYITFSGTAVLGGGTWNGVSMPVTSSYTANNLSDSTGSASDIVVAISSSYNLGANDNSNNNTVNPLLRDYVHNNYGSNINVMLSELVPYAYYAIVVYTAGDGTDQGVSITGDITGTTNADYRTSYAKGVNYVIATTIADSSGEATFTLSPNGSQTVALNGLQIGMFSPTDLVNVDFNGWQNPATFTGDGVLGGGTWNGILASGSTPYTVNNLLDSTGADTTIDVTIYSYNLGNHYNSTGSMNDLLSDYASSHSGVPLSVTISDLVPYATYDLVIYAAGDASSQDVSITNALTGTTTADQRTSYVEGVNYVFGTATADSSGVLTLTVDNLNSEYSVVNGLQIRRLSGAMMASSTLESVTINDSSAQRSSVTDLTVTFDGDVVVDSDAFSVVNQDDNSAVAMAMISAYIDGKTVVTMTFGGGNSLADGNYLLSIDGNKVRDRATGARLDGDGDGVAGGDYLFGDQANDAFFRLFGDTDGDRDVDNFDFARFRTTMGRKLDDFGFLAYLDADGDGDVDGLDFGRFRSRIGTMLAI